MGCVVHYFNKVLTSIPAEICVGTHNVISTVYLLTQACYVIAWLSTTTPQWSSITHTHRLNEHQMVVTEGFYLSHKAASLSVYRSEPGLFLLQSINLYYTCCVLFVTPLKNQWPIYLHKLHWQRSQSAWHKSSKILQPKC